MDADHGGLDVAVARELLDCADVIAGFEEVGLEKVDGTRPPSIGGHRRRIRPNVGQRKRNGDRLGWVTLDAGVGVAEATGDEKAPVRARFRRGRRSEGEPRHCRRRGFSRAAGPAALPLCPYLRTWTASGGKPLK